MVAEKGLPEIIKKALSPSLNHEGYRLVQLKIESGSKSKTLQILAEPLDLRPMTIDDCTKVSRMASAILDVEDVIDTAYNLEVSSPGIDRPLVEARDFIDFLGFDAKIETSSEIEGRKNFKGKIIYASEDVVKVRVHDGEFEIPVDAIYKAKLLFSNELVEFSKNRFLKKAAG